MDYNTFFNSPSVRDRIITSLGSQQAASTGGAPHTSPFFINTVSYQPIEQMNYGFKYNFFNLKNNRMISSFLPMETSTQVWTTLMGLAVPVLCYAGYKVWKWIIQFDEENKQEPYEYKYIKELDDMLQTKLDDIQNPEMANVDTIRVGKIVIPLDVFKSFKRNFRKRLIRKTDEIPIVKRVPIPTEEFDWKNSFVEEFVPTNGYSVPTANIKTIVGCVSKTDLVDNSGNETGDSNETGDNVISVPNGKRVMMRYEPETESFWWYSDTTSIQYKYLETVARKYVCDFNRLDVFVDIREELKKGAEESKKRKMDEDNENENDGRDTSINEKKIYAKFKRYNKKAARSDPSLSKKMMIIKAKANRYSYKGKICDYEKLINDKNGMSEKDTNEAEHVSWSEWKKINFDYWK